MKSILRSVAAIISGFIVITLLSLGADAVIMNLSPELFTGDGSTKNFVPLIFALLYSCFFYAAGGYVTAWIAQRFEVLHAFALALLLLVMTILATVQMFDTAPLWWHLAILILIIPSVMIGGYLRSSSKRKFYPLKA